LEDRPSLVCQTGESHDAQALTVSSDDCFSGSYLDAVVINSEPSLLLTLLLKMGRKQEPNADFYILAPLGLALAEIIGDGKDYNTTTLPNLGREIYR
jgi:hypothetical protein